MSGSIQQSSTDSYSEALFLFDSKNKRILFSSTPVKDFFEQPLVDSNHDFTGLFDIISSDAEKTKKEWITALALKEGKTHNFSFHKTPLHNNSPVYNIEVRAISLPAISGSPVLFIHGKKIPAKNGGALSHNSSLSCQKDYAEFIDLAAHDLDAPLRKLSVLVDRVVEKIGPGTDLQGHISRIQTCLTDMRTMIDRLSAYAAIDADDTPPQPCDLTALANEVMLELKQAIEEKGMSVVINPLPTVTGRKEQLQQLLKSLLENALRFADRDRKPVAEFSSTLVSEQEKQQHRFSPGTEYVKIVLKDNGIGFANADAEKIFQPFVRLNGKSEYPGSGMGLAICRKIAGKHNGIIYAEGEEANGASFTLILPQT